MEIWSYPTVQWLGYLIKIWISPFHLKTSFSEWMPWMSWIQYIKTMATQLPSVHEQSMDIDTFLRCSLQCLGICGVLTRNDRDIQSTYVLLAWSRLLHHEFKRQPKLSTWDEEIAWNMKFLDIIWHGYCLILWLCSHLLKFGPVLQICCQDRVSLRNH